VRIVVDADFHPALRSRLLAFSHRKEFSFCVCVSAFSSAVFSFFLVLVFFFPLHPLVLKGRSFIGKQYWYSFHSQ
jgi:hypothetical protein